MLRAEPAEEGHCGIEMFRELQLRPTLTRHLSFMSVDAWVAPHSPVEGAITCSIYEASRSPFDGGADGADEARFRGSLA